MSTLFTPERYFLFQKCSGNRYWHMERQTNQNLLTVKTQNSHMGKVKLFVASQLCFLSQAIPFFSVVCDTAGESIFSSLLLLTLSFLIFSYFVLLCSFLFKSSLTLSSITFSPLSHSFFFFLQVLHLAIRASFHTC